MVNTVTGVIALVCALAFLGYYAVSINSLPLWLIIVGCLAAAAYDYVKSVRERRLQGDGNGSD